MGRTLTIDTTEYCKLFNIRTAIGLSTYPTLSYTIYKLLNSGESEQQKELIVWIIYHTSSIKKEKPLEHRACFCINNAADWIWDVYPKFYQRRNSNCKHAQQ